MSAVKYPNIKVKLTGTDGNAYAILGNINRALQKAGVDQKERDRFFREATAGNYDQLLQTCCKWVSVR
jgi:hypothetical protein